MCSKEDYEKASDWFHQFVSLSDNSRNQRLAELENTSPGVARCLRLLLGSDQVAENEDFLGEATDLGSTLTLHLENQGVPSTGAFPEQIGTYRIEEQIGAGGMGVVYRAVDTKGDRDVALKVIRAREFASHEQLERFRAEARASARMRHPNIVPVYEIGTDGDRDYFTMAFIKGSDLKSRIKNGPIESRVAATLLRDISEAVAYAHSQGVVHRDIKPANVLIDASGQPLITDFGIAKRLDQDEPQTSTGQMVGTYQYAAPEQLEDAKRVGPSADIYSLGATLYECLTGTPPFKGENLAYVISQVKQRMPPSPSTVNPAVDEDLSAICMLCLSKSSNDRYPTVHSLITDLDRFLRNEPVQAQAGSSWRNVSRLITYQSSPTTYASRGAASWVVGVGFLVHTLIFTNLFFWQSHVALWTILGLWGIAATSVSYYYHWSRYWELHVEERLSGILQLTVNLGLVCLFAIHGPLSLEHPVTDFAGVYPGSCLLLGSALCVHGGFYSGRWLLIGGIYFPLSVVMSFIPAIWTPLVFCTALTLTSALADREIRRDAAIAG